ncbi:hypothetical protein [Pantoea agglomerans]|uniref:Uncharacterized protein n=1 Tax=Enterobacter agglomerans TaxID=549 RepID=A0ACC5RL89_ENTAG|nr:hypothetical protein [Pantoea agglomerans]MBK4725407.1 hypothetical protein [Pantoea agglomerans]
MDKNHLFSHLEKWPLIKFDHANIVQDGDHGTFNAKTSLYAFDANENKAKLFIRDVSPGTDIVAMIDLYTNWIKEFKKTTKST